MKAIESAILGVLPFRIADASSLIDDSAQHAGTNISGVGATKAQPLQAALGIV